MRWYQKTVKANKLCIYGLLVLFSMVCGCADYNPKPKAYPRITYPEKVYVPIETSCPFSFEMPTYAKLENYPEGNQPCWYNLNYTPFDATLHLTYVPMHGIKDLDSLTEDAYKMVFKPHLQPAEEIIERELTDSVKGFYGMIYDLEGKTATPLNFYITDKKKHFFRGSFYFNARTERDSILPVYQFINKDIQHAIETFEFR